MEDLEGEEQERSALRSRHFSAGARASLRRQLSEATPKTSAEHMVGYPT